MWYVYNFKTGRLLTYEPVKTFNGTAVRPLFATQFFGALNDNVFRFAIIVFITFKIPESTVSDTKSLVAITTAIFILPFFLISGIAGQIADKYEKSRIVRNLKNMEIILALLAGIGFYFKSYPALLVILFLMGTNQLFSAHQIQFVASTPKTDDLTGANGLIQQERTLPLL